MELSGGWDATPADGPSPPRPGSGADDREWRPITVPGFWRSEPAFAEVDGPLLYRRRFSAAPPAPGERAWLTFAGVFDQADVWLDGSYVGDIEGYFVHHDFDITAALHERTDHDLMVGVSAHRPDHGHARRDLNGTIQRPELADWAPGGIWAPVAVRRTGSVRLRHSRVICEQADHQSATLRIRAVLDAADVCEVDLRTTLSAPGAVDLDHRLVQPLAAGENRVEWPVTIPSPRLWWPRELGDQHLYQLTLAVLLQSGRCSDYMSRRTGLRSIEMDRWTVSINGEQLHLRGACLRPRPIDLAATSAPDHRRELALAADLGMNVLRLTGHITPPAFYDEADQAGMLLWQDLPVHGDQSPSVRQAALRQAREAVDQLGHHPSVALWCAHDRGGPARSRPNRSGAARVRSQWSRTLLDRTIRRAIRQNDPSRPVTESSHVVATPAHPDGGATELFYGWDHGSALDLGPAIARLPRRGQFVSAFGARAAPSSNPAPVDLASSSDDWIDGHLDEIQRAPVVRFVAPADHTDRDEWAQATQRYQAELVRHHVETLRRLKYRPNGGFTVFELIDRTDGLGFGLFDLNGRPKLAAEAFRRASAPIVVVADRFPPQPLPGDLVSAEVHLVNDERRPVIGCVVARLSSPTADRTWTWEGTAPADSCVRIGDVETVVGRPGELLTMELWFIAEDGTRTETNRYETRIGLDR